MGKESFNGQNFFYSHILLGLMMGDGFCLKMVTKNLNSIEVESLTF